MNFIDQWRAIEAHKKAASDIGTTLEATAAAQAHYDAMVAKHGPRSDAAKKAHVKLLEARTQQLKAEVALLQAKEAA